MKKLLLVLVLAVSVSFAGIDVLVAHCDPGATSDAEAAITHADYDSVDFMNVSSSGGTTPDVATLAAYDVVLTWSNFTMPTQQQWVTTSPTTLMVVVRLLSVLLVSSVLELGLLDVLLIMQPIAH
ncbi:hypothetical protein K8R78_05100 [bacterium]|nr:hypothetical protein [bacterium]